MESDTLFVKATDTWRQNADPLNLKPLTSRLEGRNNGFVLRIISKWNALPREIKTMKPIQAFNNYLKSMHMSMVEGAAAE